MRIGPALKILRKATGYSLDEVSNLTHDPKYRVNGRSRTSLSDYEARDKRTPSIDYIHGLVEIYVDLLTKESLNVCKRIITCKTALDSIERAEKESNSLFSNTNAREEKQSENEKRAKLKVNMEECDIEEKDDMLCIDYGESTEIQLKFDSITTVEDCIVYLEGVSDYIELAEFDVEDVLMEDKNKLGSFVMSVERAVVRAASIPRALSDIRGQISYTEKRSNWTFVWWKENCDCFARTLHYLSVFYQYVLDGNQEGAEKVLTFLDRCGLTVGYKK